MHTCREEYLCEREGERRWWEVEMPYDELHHSPNIRIIKSRRFITCLQEPAIGPLQSDMMQPTFSRLIYFNSSFGALHGLALASSTLRLRPRLSDCCSANCMTRNICWNTLLLNNGKKCHCWNTILQWPQLHLCNNSMHDVREKDFWMSV
jgi:hypothetical protein